MEQSTEKQVEERKETVITCHCGYCGKGFPTTDELWDHCRNKHDPDGIAYSEFGPK